MKVASPQYGPHSKTVVVKPSSRPTSGRTYGGSYCSCNRVCVCIPVCQAHRLLHPDPVVRTMAEEILLWMGRREFDYMRWAASHAEAALQKAVQAVMSAIRAGAHVDPRRWPSLVECRARLGDADEVVGIMAAQMIAMRNSRKQVALDEQERVQVERLLALAQSRPWYLRGR